MFKRVEKRIRKKEKEEELGIDEDMKEMLGMHDTDSEESDSSSSEDEGVDVAGVFDGDSNGSGAEEDAEEDDEEDEDAEDSGEEQDENTPMTISEVLQDPLFTIQEEPEIKTCIICPGKLLKNPIMIDVHLNSVVSTT